MSERTTSDRSSLGALFAGVFEELSARLLGEVEQRIEAVRAELLARIEARGERPRGMTIDQACKAFGFSRATFERWDQDPASGIHVAISRPNGPRGRVVVLVDELEAWLRDRRQLAPVPRRGTAVAKRRRA